MSNPVQFTYGIDRGYAYSLQFSGQCRAATPDVNRLVAEISQLMADLADVLERKESE